MKKILIAFAIIFTILVVACSISNQQIKYGDPLEELRGICATVESVDGDRVCFHTNDGNLWYKTIDFEIDPDGYYCLMFDTKGTEEITDDTIEMIFEEVG